MKIIDEQNGVERIFVHIEDLKFLCSYEPTILPKPLLIKLLFIVRFSKFKNLDYIKFDKKQEVDFFKNLDCILSFDISIDMKKEEIEKELKDLTEQRKNLYDIIFSSMEDPEEPEPIDIKSIFKQINMVDMRYINLEQALRVKNKHLQKIWIRG